MPSVHELIAYGRDVDEICDEIGADGMIYQSLDDLIAAVRECNPEITRFDTSVFDGNYITNDIDQNYLNQLDANRNDSAKQEDEDSLEASIEVHNDSN